MKNETEMAGGIPVDVGRLNTGLRTVFYGVSEVFASIGVKDAADALAHAADAADPKAKNNTSDHNDEIPQADSPTESGTKGTVQNEALSSGEKRKENLEQVEHKKTEEVRETVGAPAEQTAPEEAKKSSVSVEDIINVCARKIALDRSVSPKIETILSSYGVAKLTDLPKASYEDFLTRIAAL